MSYRIAASQCRSFALSTRSSISSSNLPRVASPEIWRSIVPKFMRRRRPESGDAITTHEPRTGLSLIVLGLVAGSFAINIISLRREILNFSRQTEAKLAVLREVIERVKNGEDVDVKSLLGTGDPQSEAEWEEVVRELEDSNNILSKRRQQAFHEKQKARMQDGRRQKELQESKEDVDASQVKSSDQRRPNFMM